MMREDKNILDSWKEIASYLDRTIKTCRKWEKELGLPIHRLDGSPRASVFAYKEELDCWLEEILKKKPITSKKIAAHFTLRKALFPLIAAAIFVIVALFIWHPWSKSQAPPVQTDKPTLAVIYFKNNTGDKNLDHWRSALSDLLISDLSQSKYLTILPEDRLYNILSELELLEAEDYTTNDLEKVAARGYVENILIGNYVKAGDNFRINASLRNINAGESIRLESVEGIGEESFFTMVDELTKRIKSSLDLSTEKIASDIDKDIGKITTSSLEAYKAYADYWRLVRLGKWGDAESIDKLEEALTYDPEFAMAYRTLGLRYRRFPDKKEEGMEYLKKAFELSDRISDRERFIIEGTYYRNLSEKTWDKSIDAYKNLFELYQDDWIGNNNLSNIYISLEEWDKCLQSEKYLYPGRRGSFIGLIEIAYMAKGLYEKAREIHVLFSKRKYENAWEFYIEARIHLCQGEYEQALSVVEEGIMAKVRNTILLYELKGDIYHLNGDWVKAEEQYIKGDKEDQIGKLWAFERLAALYLLPGKFKKSEEQLKQGILLAEEIEDTAWQTNLHLALAYVYLKSKDTENALAECNKALNIAVEYEAIRSQIRALDLKGLILLESDSIQAAKETAREIKSLVESWLNMKLMRYHLHLMGMIESKSRNLTDAIDNFNRANSFLSHQYDVDTDNHSLFYDSLASVYYESGDLERAREEYIKITSLSAGRLHNADIYVKSFYMLGKIHEQKGEKAEAIEHYKKFLNLWKDADPGIVEIEDAKERLAVLTSNQ